MPRLPLSLLRRGKTKLGKMKSHYPELGAKWGPREGFYSKAERVWAEKGSGAMTPPQLVKFLRNQGVKEVEIRALGLDNLVKRYPDAKMEYDEWSEWMINRRPNYKEHVQAQGGTGLANKDYDTAREWRQEDARREAEERASERYTVEDETRTRYVDEDGDEVDEYYVSYDAERGTDIDTRTGEPVTEVEEESYRIWDSEYQEYVEDVFDDQAEAESRRTEIMVEEVDEYIQEGLEELDDDEIDQWVNDTFGSWEVFNERRGVSTAETQPSSATEYGLEPNAGRPDWMRWHHANESEVPGEKTVNLITNIPASAKTQRDAIAQEIRLRDDLMKAVLNKEGDFAQLSDDQLTQALRQVEDQIGMRQNMLVRTEDPALAHRTYSFTEPEHPGQFFSEEGDFVYGTHWGARPGVLQHQRGFYDIPETKPAGEPPQWAQGRRRHGYNTGAEAREAGFRHQYRWVPESSEEGPGTLYIDIFGPDGNRIRSQDYRVPRRPDGDTLPTIWGRVADDLTRTGATEFLRSFSQDVPTGRKGMNISEYQADFAQQMGGKGVAPRRSTIEPGTREESVEQLREALGSRPLGDRPGKVVGQTEVASPPSSAEAQQLSIPNMETGTGVEWPRLARMTGHPAMQERLQMLRATNPSEGSKLEQVLRAARTYDQNGSPLQPGHLDYLLEQARQAGVPEEIIRTTPRTTQTVPAIVGQHEFNISNELRSALQHWQTEYRNYVNDMTPQGYQSDMFLEIDDFGNPYSPVNLSGFDPYSPSDMRVRPNQPVPLEDVADVNLQRSKLTAPMMPLVPDERLMLGAKRTLLEAAHADQDFVAWPYADTQLVSNMGASGELFPMQYGLGSYGGSGQIAKNMEAALKMAGVKAKSTEIGIDFPAQADVGEHQMRDVRNRAGREDILDPGQLREKKGVTTPRRGIYLTEEARKKIKERGFPFYVIPPWLAAALGYEGEDQYVFTGDVF